MKTVSLVTLGTLKKYIFKIIHSKKMILKKIHFQNCFLKNSISKKYIFKMIFPKNINLKLILLKGLADNSFHFLREKSKLITAKQVWPLTLYQIALYFCKKSSSSTKKYIHLVIIWWYHHKSHVLTFFKSFKNWFISSC